MRYNSYTVQITCFSCTINWVLVYSQNSVAIATINFKTFSSPQKETLDQLAVSPPALGNR